MVPVLRIFYEKSKNVSCEYDRWVVESKLCKLRDTSDTLMGHACAMFHFVIWCSCITSTIRLLLLSSTSFMVSSSSVLHLFLMKDIGL